MPIKLNTVVDPAALSRQPTIWPSREIPALPGLIGWWQTQEAMRYTETDGREAIRTLGPTGRPAGLKSGQAYPSAMPFETVAAPSGRSYRLSKAYDDAAASGRHWMGTLNLPTTGWVSLVAAAKSAADAVNNEAWSIQWPSTTQLFSSPHKTSTKSSILLSGTPGTQVDFARANLGEWWWEVVAFNLATGEVRRSLNGAAYESATLGGLAGMPVANPVTLRVWAKSQGNFYKGHGADFGIAVGNWLDGSQPAALTYIDRYLAALYGI